MHYVSCYLVTSYSRRIDASVGIEARCFANKMHLVTSEEVLKFIT